MKHNRNILLPLLVVPTLLAFESRGEDVAFQPEAGTTLTKSYEISSVVELDDMTMVMNGQEMDSSAFGMEMETTSTMTLSVTDEYIAVKDGMPIELKRTFDEIGTTTEMSMSNQMMGDMDQDLDGTSSLEGKTVHFKWNGDTEEYDVSFADDEEDEELLENLDIDMDLRGFLPDGEVAVGDSWDVDPQAIRPLFVPGGALKVEVDWEQGMMGNPPPPPDELLGDFEGDLKASLKEIADRDGARVAVIDLKINVSTSNDLTEFMGDMMSEFSPEGMSIDITTMDAEFGFDGGGELAWNLSRGTVHSLKIEGQLEQTMDMAMSMMDTEMEQTMTLTGDQTVSITTVAGS